MAVILYALRSREGSRAYFPRKGGREDGFRTKKEEGADHYHKLFKFHPRTDTASHARHGRTYAPPSLSGRFERKGGIGVNRIRGIEPHITKNNGQDLEGVGDNF